ncbi:hypothetical protein [Sphingomonas sp. Ag1]|jgi:hypothetical protein|uniref:hypothetical protein n=1 Tax=Sphingomonas sp. Ag1 TaxID=1642949 RepID=UPI000698BC0E|nr:hypothetical protein [Sphingomonas sp. Ag1]
MAKKDKKGFRIPKEIGGIKVPKEARRAGEALIEKASTPAGRQAIASGLAMAATAAAAVAARQAREHGCKNDQRAAARDQATGADNAPGADAGAAGAPGTGGTTVDPSRVVDALSDAAGVFMSSLFAKQR